MNSGVAICFVVRGGMNVVLTQRQLLLPLLRSIPKNKFFDPRLDTRLWGEAFMLGVWVGRLGGWEVFMKNQCDKFVIE